MSKAASIHCPCLCNSHVPPILDDAYKQTERNSKEILGYTVRKRGRRLNYSVLLMTCLDKNGAGAAVVV